jgi:hypothetical protein
VANLKAEQRNRVLVGFGLLCAPLNEIRQRTDAPQHADYRMAIARTQGGAAKWRESVLEFTTFTSDIQFAQQQQAIDIVVHQLWETLRKRVLPIADLTDMKKTFDEVFDAFVTNVPELISHVPVEWQPEIFSANTPFTAYLRIRQAVAIANHRLAYFDRYLKPEFYTLFLSEVSRTLPVTLVTTAQGIRDVAAVSALAAKEFTSYQLVEVDPSVMHDRNLIVDDQVFSLGPGADRAGIALTNFGPSDSSQRAQDEFDKIVAGGTIIHRS